MRYCILVFTFLKKEMNSAFITDLLTGPWEALAFLEVYVPEPIMHFQEHCLKPFLVSTIVYSVGLVTTTV